MALIECKHCGKKISDKAKICPGCGKATISDSNTADSTITCVECGAQLKEGLESCPNCGCPIDNVNDVVDNDRRKQGVTKLNNHIAVPVLDGIKKHFKKLLIAAGSFIIITMILLLAFGAFEPKLSSISAKYTGITTAGALLDRSNDGIVVTGIKKDGEKVTIPSSKWKILEPKKLNPDNSAIVEIVYRDLSCKLQVKCTTSLVKNLTASYNGETAEGTSITINSSGLLIYAEYVNGTTKLVTKDCIIESDEIILQRDSTSDIKIKYIDPVNNQELNTVLPVKCSTRTVKSISATYSGDKSAGVKLNDSNADIIVTAKYADGSSEIVSGWTIDSTKTLLADTTTSVKISFEGKTCTLSVTCTTVSPAKYKASCKSINYNDLARTPSSYKGEKVVFKGKVVQVQDGTYYSIYRIATSGSYNNIVYVTFFGYLSSRILEDDIVMFYGEYQGLETYTTIMGGSVTIPSVSAQYIDPIY